MTADGLVFSCGYGLRGQLGVGDKESRLVPTLVRGELKGRKVLQVAAGGYRTMCVTEDGSVFAFGKNDNGQLGVGGRESKLLPTLVRGELQNEQVLRVAAGASHTMFVTADGMVFACGDNSSGQLGVCYIQRGLVPTLVTGQLQGKAAVDAAAGGDHTLCTTTDGSLFAWGSNFGGQLGLGGTENRRVPTLVTGLQGKQVVHVAAGSYHTVCTTADGSVFTWGRGGFGGLGQGDDQFSKLVPTQVSGDLQNKAVLQVAAGDQHSICVAGDSSVYTWGNNFDGQLGVDGSDGADLPVLLQVLDLNENAQSA